MNKRLINSEEDLGTFSGNRPKEYPCVLVYLDDFEQYTYIYISDFHKECPNEGCEYWDTSWGCDKGGCIRDGHIEDYFDLFKPVSAECRNYTATPLRVIYENDCSPKCPKCGSSLKHRYAFWIKNKKCIQPKCENYYGK